MLKLEKSWRFDSPGPIPQAVINAFSEFINRISGQGNKHSILETFKSHFANAAGAPHYVSSNERWAQSDLDGLMVQAAANAPLFIDAFCGACHQLTDGDSDIAVPDAGRVNAVLAEHGAGYEIRGQSLVQTGKLELILVPERPPSLDAQAQEMIEKALRASEGALAQGQGRQAVQEVLWVLETISTAFRGTGDGSVQGRYFSKIIGELRRSNRGSHQEQILTWMATLYGFLSSPSGGGIRHGIDLTEGAAVQLNEARLYCNLVRSYIAYLIAEHGRLSTTE